MAEEQNIPKNNIEDPPEAEGIRQNSEIPEPLLRNNTIDETQPPKAKDEVDTISPTPQVSTAESKEALPETLFDPPPSTLHHQSSNMEVHHHGHVHEQKKWKEYVFQFLMLFLAIILGFFVENQREHYVEHLRARQYASTMLQDLQADKEAGSWHYNKHHNQIKNRYSFAALPSR